MSTVEDKVIRESQQAEEIPIVIYLSTKNRNGVVNTVAFGTDMMFLLADLAVPFYSEGVYRAWSNSLLNSKNMTLKSPFYKLFI